MPIVSECRPQAMEAACEQQQFANSLSSTCSEVAEYKGRESDEHSRLAN